MAITPTDRGTTFARTISPPTATSLTTTSATFTPAAGAVLVVPVESRVTTGPFSAVLSDTFADTGGTAWVEQVSNNADGAYVGAIWTRLVGSGPVSGAITVSSSADATDAGRFVEGTYLELTGASSATPLQAANGHNATTPLTLTLGAAPAATSIVITNVIDNNGTTTTVPSGYTTVHLAADYDSYGVAYLNGSATASVSWTGLGASSNTACAIEIAATATPPTGQGGFLIAPDAKTRRRFGRAPLIFRNSSTIPGATGSAAVTLGAFTMAASGTFSAEVRGSIWTKTLTAAGGTETFTASAATEGCLAFVILRGASAVDVSGSTSGYSAQGDSPSVTTTQADEMVLWAHFRDDNTITVAPGTGTNVGPVQSSATGTRAALGANYQAQPVAGASGTRRFGGASADSWAAGTISVIGIAGGITGTIAVTLAAFTMVASGTSSPPSVTGTIAVTLGAFTMVATGTSTTGSAPPVLVGDLTSAPRLAEGFSNPRWD